MLSTNPAISHATPQTTPPATSPIVPPRFPGPFTPSAIGDHLAITQALANTGFTRSNLIKLGLVGQGAIPAIRIVASDETELRGDLAIMVRLWMLAEPVPATRIRQALGESVTDRLLASGLLTESATDLRAAACLLPLQQFWTLRDFDPRETGAPMRIDHVPSVSLSTALVANFTVRSPAKLGLDLGCGSGYQALRLSMHCDKVIATDINDRCLNFAEMSMAINGVTNVELRKGSLFDPVEGLTFDAIASNPPFVISPGSELIFRDSGLPGDQVSERLIRRFADILDDGGWATILFNWHHRADDAWADKPRAWTANKACDAWLIRLRTDRPEDYARSWIITGQGGIGDVDPAKLAEWTRYYQSIGAEAISLAAMIIRKRTHGAPNWFRVDMPDQQEEMDSASDQVVRIFAAEAALRSGVDLRDLRLRLTPASRLTQTLISSPVDGGRWAPTTARLTLADGLVQPVHVALPVAEFLPKHDGSRTVRELAHASAAEWKTTPELAESAVIDPLAKLLRDGYFEIVQP